MSSEEARPYVELREELHRPAKRAARERIVLELYRLGETSSGKAAELLGVGRETFIRRASEQGIVPPAMEREIGPSFRRSAASARRRPTRGRFLCHESYCESYRPSARRGAPPDTGSAHVGFRLVRRS